MSVSWTINGTSVSALGLEVAGGDFRTGAPSSMRLSMPGSFTAAAGFSWGDPITLARNGTPFFRGKVVSLPVSGSETDESLEIEVVDAWHDLESTTYLESWPAGSGSVQLPMAVLGRRSDGAAITDAQQIEEAIAYAISVGIDLQMGSVPPGLPMWPSQVSDTNIAEVIRVSCRYHPDWIPWIDYATSPPTFHVTERAAAGTLAIDIGSGETSSVNVTRRDDLRPESIRIVYLRATTIDDEVYRDYTVDKAPSGGPDEGPGTINIVVELAGLQVQVQKSRVQTRPIPTDSGEAREWLKKKYPAVFHEMPDGAWTVTLNSRTLVEDGEEHPDPVNPRARRMPVDDADDLPRELVRGSIEDWMRRKVGKVRLGLTIAPSGSATAEHRERLEGLASTRAMTVTATNAITKLYKGITQWTAPEDVPEGIAQSVYDSLFPYQYEGSITTVSEDVTATRFHGRKLNILGGRGEWTLMEALVTGVNWQVGPGTMTVSFGPAPYLSATDLLDLQRMLRDRKVHWMSSDERTSNELGANNDPSGKGDTVDGYDTPETTAEVKTAATRGRFTPYIGGEDGTSLYVTPGTVTYYQISNETDQDDDDTADYINVKPLFPTIGVTRINAATAPSFDVASRSNAALWLCTLRTKCGGSTVPGEDSPERIEIVNRGAKPDKKDGERHLLLCEFDLENSGGGKTITNLDLRVASDVEVAYSCIDTEASETSEEQFDSDKWDSSDASDVPNDSSDSGEDPDCPWIGEAIWVGKRTCYSSKGKSYVGFKVRVRLTGSYYSKCRNWKATVSAPGGIAYGKTSSESAEPVGASFEVALPQKFNEFSLVFEFEPAKCLIPQFVTVAVSSEEKEPPAADSSCCGGALGTKQFNVGSWPGYCDLKGACGTTVIP